VRSRQFTHAIYHHGGHRVVKLREAERGARIIERDSQRRLVAFASQEEHAPGTVQMLMHSKVTERISNGRRMQCDLAAQSQVFEPEAQTEQQPEMIALRAPRRCLQQ